MSRTSFPLIAPISLLVAMAYGTTLWNGFIWDDDDYVTENAALRSADGLAAIWTDPSATPQYYPLVHSTFWFEYQMWGLNPVPYHITNAALHAAVAVCLWFVLQRLSIPGAWFCAAIFAVHPVHVESVAWVTERKNVLSGLFYLWAFWSLIRFQEQSSAANSDRMHWRFYGLAVGLFIAALLSKTVTCTLPAAFLVVNWWKDGRVSPKSVALMLPFFVVGIALALNTAAMERSQVGAEGAEFSWTTAERIQIAGRSLWMYLWKLLVPLNLCFFYPKWHLDSGSPGCWIAPILAIAFVGLLVATVRAAGRGPLAAFLFFGGTLFPALGFFNVFPMRYSYFADHFQYLASIGPITLVGSLLWQWANRSKEELARVRSIILTVIVLAPLVVLCSRQCLIYRDLQTLWQETLAKNPESDIAMTNLASLFHKNGKRDEAYRLLVESVSVKPEHNYEAMCSLMVIQGEDLAMDGKLDEAVVLFQKAAAIGLPGGRPQFSLGLVLLEKNEVSDAIACFNDSLRRNEMEPGTHYHLARAYLIAGEIAKAILHLDRALELRPGWEKAQTLRAGLH